MSLRRKFLILGVLLLAGCAAKPLKVNCAKPVKPDCGATVEFYKEEYEKQVAETMPDFTEPQPHDLIDLISCIKLLETAY